MEARFLKKRGCRIERADNIKIYNIQHCFQEGEGMARTFDEINSKIKDGEVVVVTAEEFKELVEQKGVSQAARKLMLLQRLRLARCVLAELF